jgi:GNAT superfamily N-acetyltransferase
VSALLDAQAEYLAYLGGAPSAEAREEDGVLAVMTGVSSNSENGVVSRGRVENVAALVAWFADRRVPASWIAADDVVAAELVAAGARPENGGWEMAAPIARIELAHRPEVDVDFVESPAALDAWFDLAAVSGWFGDPSERAPFQRLYGELIELPDRRVRLYLARLETDVVGFAAAFFGASSLLLTNVGVLERARRRGVATALAAARFRDAADAGCDRAVLAPSPSGRPLYEALGFDLHRTPPDRWYYLPC